MASQMAILARTRTLFKTLNHYNSFKPISTFTFLSQEPQLADSPLPPSPPPSESTPPPPQSESTPPPPPFSEAAPPLPQSESTPPPPPFSEAVLPPLQHESTPLPPNPASGSPLYNENWRNPAPVPEATMAQAVVPLGYSHLSPVNHFHALARTLDLESISNCFTEWVTSQNWSEMKQVFEFWIRSLDRHGRPNKPDLSLYNQYLRANLMLGANAGELLDLLARMEHYGIVPNTASHNLVLKAMCQARETQAAEKLIQRMLQLKETSPPDEESFALVIGMMFTSNQIDAALNLIDACLQSGNVLSMKVFSECVRGCLTEGKLDMLASIIEKAEKMDQSSALCPTWPMCKVIAEAAMQEGNSKLAFQALKFMAKWISRFENYQPPQRVVVDEGLVVSALATAGRTYSTDLLGGSWQILKRTLRQTKAPSPETYLAKIYAHAYMGSLPKAILTLKELECTYVNSDKETEELFSPFTSLYPLAVACSKNAFETLDWIYYELEKLSNAKSPYKSINALNCIIVGCANTWDLDRAYQTFEAISASFGLTPNIHSYNALMYAFGKLNKAFDAAKVFEHFVSLGIKANAKSYALLVDAHLVNRDPRAALSVIDEMVTAGFVPSKETLKKIRRRCVREMDYESDERVEDLARKFQIRMGTESRRNTLFNLSYNTEYVG